MTLLTILEANGVWVCYPAFVAIVLLALHGTVGTTFQERFSFAHSDASLYVAFMLVAATLLLYLKFGGRYEINNH